MWLSMGFFTGSRQSPDLDFVLLKTLVSVNMSRDRDNIILHSYLIVGKQIRKQSLVKVEMYHKYLM